MQNQVAPKRRNYKGWTKEFMEFKQDEVKKRRDQMQQSAQNQRVLWLQRMNLVRQIRAETLTEKAKELKQQNLARTWCIFVATYNLVYKKIYQNWSDHIEQYRRLVISKIIQMKIRNTWLERAKMYGESLEIRLNRQTRSALNIIGNVSNDTVLLRAKDIFTSFVAKCGQCMTFQ